MGMMQPNQSEVAKPFFPSSQRWRCVIRTCSVGTSSALSDPNSRCFLLGCGVISDGFILGYFRSRQIFRIKIASNLQMHENVVSCLLLTATGRSLCRNLQLHHNVHSSSFAFGSFLAAFSVFFCYYVHNTVKAERTFKR